MNDVQFVLVFFML